MKVFSEKLSSGSLDMVSASCEHFLAELEGAKQLACLLEAEIDSASWPPGEYDRGAQEFFLDRLREGGDAVVGWYVWYAMLRGEGGRLPVVVGAGGYFGPPNDAGEVEIGFSIVPAHRERGFATELVRGLAGRAFADSRVRRIFARTTRSNAAACRVLEKAGFVGGLGPDGPESFGFELLRAAWSC